MVRTLTKKVTDETKTDTPPSFVELIGPAGAGKTSLSQALTQRSEIFVTPADLEVRRLRQIPVLVSTALAWLPAFLRQYRDYRHYAWQEIKVFTYLGEGHRVLQRQAANGTITILDHGPVFKLTRLHGFSPPNTRSQNIDTWWDSTFERWSKVLDLVIWLDAPDAILLDRVHARNRWHILKEKSQSEAEEFLARYRTSYEWTVSALRGNHGPRLLRFDTDQESLSQIIEKVLAAFEFAHSQG